MGNSTLPLGGGDATRLSEIILQPGHSFVPGDAVRADENNPGVYLLAQADNAVNAEAVGMVETVAGDSFEVVYQGRVDLSNVGWADLPLSLPSDQVWFLSDVNAGELTKTPPSTAGAVIKAMLVVTDDTLTFESGILTGYIGVQIGGDNTVNINEIQPVGGIIPWAADAATTVPTGWALCDGQAISRTTFVDLFNVIGTDYGVGDGATTFNIPDLQRRVPVGQDASPPFDSVANTGGQETYTPTSPEVPPHDHTQDTLSVFDPGAGTPYTAVVVGAPGVPTPNVGSSEYGPGGGVTDNNLQPYLVINFIIRTTQQAAATLLDHSLSDHDDVGDVSSPNDCDLLKFNAGTQEWEAAPGVAPAGGAVFSFRNQIINGRFDVWQRGSGTFTTPLTIGGNYTADRWVFGGGDATGVRTSAIDQGVFTLGQTDVPGAPKRFMEYQNFVVGGDSNEDSLLLQRIEDVRTFNDSQVTVSFWAKTDNVTPGQDKIAVQFRQFFGGGGGSASVELTGQEITLTTAWTYYTLTFSIPSIAAATIGTLGNDSLRLRFVTQAGASAAPAINVPNPLNFVDVLSLVNVQVEQGVAATAFEIRELETEISLCQRYFAKAWDIDTTPSTLLASVPGVFDAAEVGVPTEYRFSGAGNSPTTGDRAFGMPWPTRMRAAPSILVVQSLSPAQTLSIFSVGEHGITWRAVNTTVTWKWTADAEI